MKKFTKILLLPVLCSTALTTSLLCTMHSASYAMNRAPSTIADNEGHYQENNLPSMRGNNPVVNPGDLNRVRPFLHLGELDGGLVGQPGGLEDLSEPCNLSQHNNYPFALSGDRVLKNTLYFTNQLGKTPLEAINAGFLPLMQEYIPQFVIEDFSDLNPLIGLARLGRGIILEEFNYFK